jgi:hypothetical protein
MLLNIEDLQVNLAREETPPSNSGCPKFLVAEVTKTGRVIVPAGLHI